MGDPRLPAIVDSMWEYEVEWAYQIAREARSEEVELFWKRANYFWLFVASALATYGLLWNIADHEIDPWQYRVLIAGIGLVGTFCWVLAAMASRWASRKWLHALQILERRLTEFPLYNERSANGARLKVGVPDWQRFTTTGLTISFGVVMCFAWVALILLEMQNGVVGLNKVQYVVLVLAGAAVISLGLAVGVRNRKTGHRR